MGGSTVMGVGLLSRTYCLSKHLRAGQSSMHLLSQILERLRKENHFS